jgi:hypothetical protein
MNSRAHRQGVDSVHDWPDHCLHWSRFGRECQSGILLGDQPSRLERLHVWQHDGACHSRQYHWRFCCSALHQRDEILRMDGKCPRIALVRCQPSEAVDSRWYPVPSRSWYLYNGTLLSW